MAKSKLHKLQRQKEKELRGKEYALYCEAYKASIVAELKIEREEAAKERKLKVTKHAIERFKERIADLSEDRIKLILSSERMLQVYESNRSGKYRIVGFKNSTACIENYRVLTVWKTQPNSTPNPEVSDTTDAEQS